MLTIGKPVLSTIDNVVRLSAEIKSEDYNDVLWYEIPKEFKEFIEPENADPFLVGLLFLGMKRGQDIQIESRISALLFYNIKHYVIPALCLSDPELKKINIIAKCKTDKSLNEGNSSATGFSCGVDSFATYQDHHKEEGEFKIKYFTFFNAGSHGSGGEATRAIFKKRLKRVRDFADSIGKKVITVDSNISEILNMKFQQTNTLRNMSCALLFQKEFKHYYSASKNRFDYLKLHKYDSQDYDSMMLSLLSTESTSFHSAVAQYSRLERTELITQNAESYKFLDVCTSEKRRVGRKNCSDCNKCRRTALTLDLLDKLHLYNEVFDISKYEEKKHSFIAHIIKTRKDNQIHRDIYELLKKKNEIDYKKIAISKFNSLLRKK
jgi:hypothetical protein